MNASSKETGQPCVMSLPGRPGTKDSERFLCTCLCLIALIGFNSLRGVPLWSAFEIQKK